ncbi:phosphorylase family protein [Vagococcus teuberi]
MVETFDAVAVDMETSAIAHVCFINEMPSLSIRGIGKLE